MAGDSQHLYQEMPAVKGIGRKPKAGTVKNKLIVEGPQLRKVRMKMKMLDDGAKDRSKLLKKQITCISLACGTCRRKAQAGSLKDEVDDAVASVEVHSRKYKIALKRRDLAVRLGLAFVNRSERLHLKKIKRSKAWVRKHLAQYEEFESRANVAENNLEYAEIELECAEQKLELVLATVKSVQMRMRAFVSAEKK